MGPLPLPLPCPAQCTLQRPAPPPPQALTLGLGAVKREACNGNGGLGRDRAGGYVSTRLQVAVFMDCRSAAALPGAPKKGCLALAPMCSCDRHVSHGLGPLKDRTKEQKRGPTVGLGSGVAANVGVGLPHVVGTVGGGGPQQLGGLLVDVVLDLCREQGEEQE